MSVTLLRHTTPKVAPGTCYGRLDLDVAGSFHEEADRVLASLPSFASIQSSPLRRCRKLARRIAVHVESEERLSNYWIEMDFGSWCGAAWSDIPRAQIDGWAADFKYYNDHGGESVAQLRRRVEQALDRVSDGTLIVTHAGVIKAALDIAGQPGAWDHQTPFGGFVQL